MTNQVRIWYEVTKLRELIVDEPPEQVDAMRWCQLQAEQAERPEVGRTDHGAFVRVVRWDTARP